MIYRNGYCRVGLLEQYSGNAALNENKENSMKDIVTD